MVRQIHISVRVSAGGSCSLLLFSHTFYDRKRQVVGMVPRFECVETDSWEMDSGQTKKTRLS